MQETREIGKNDLSINQSIDYENYLVEVGIWAHRTLEWTSRSLQRSRAFHDPLLL